MKPSDYRCDGETLFGFTVKACDKPATRLTRNTPHEEYAFCDRHYYFYLHGRYPDQDITMHRPEALPEDSRHDNSDT